MGLSADAEDWVGVLAGDGQAMGRIFDRHRDAVRRSARPLVESPLEAEDVLAVVFLEAWRRRESIRLVDGSLRPWLLVLAIRAARNVHRVARRHRALLGRLPPSDGAAGHSDPPDDLEAAATAALRRLPIADREVLALCMLERLSEREAAAVLRVHPHTVRSRLHRATVRLSRAGRTPTPRRRVRTGLRPPPAGPSARGRDEALRDLLVEVADAGRRSRSANARSQDGLGSSSGYSSPP